MQKPRLLYKTSTIYQKQNVHCKHVCCCTSQTKSNASISHGGTTAAMLQHKSIFSLHSVTTTVGTPTWRKEVRRCGCDVSCNGFIVFPYAIGGARLRLVEWLPLGDSAVLVRIGDSTLRNQMPKLAWSFVSNSCNYRRSSAALKGKLGRQRPIFQTTSNL